MTNELAAAHETIEYLSFDAAIESVKNEVDRALSASPKIIRGYTQHLAMTKGKFIRAVSLITCAENKNGLIHPNAVKAAAAIEILHLATLVHDDVIDNAKTRRGAETLQKKFGKRTAVICGDYLFCLALKNLESIPNKKDYADLDFVDYIGKVCLGELTQHVNNGNLDLSVFTYLKIISGKTAALFEASFFGGIVLCDDEPKNLEMYKRLGHYIGMIFQLNDDCLDYEATQELAKKPVQSDFDQGVITLPLIYAFEKSKEFKDKLRNSKMGRSELNRIVLEAGGLDYTHATAKKYYNKASRIILELNETLSKQERLLFLLNKSYNGLKK